MKLFHAPDKMSVLLACTPDICRLSSREALINDAESGGFS